MTGIIRIGVTERGRFKKYSEAVHIPVLQRLCITKKLPLTYSEAEAHLLEQRLCYRMTCNFSLVHVL